MHFFADFATVRFINFRLPWRGAVGFFCIGQHGGVFARQVAQSAHLPGVEADASVLLPGAQGNMVKRCDRHATSEHRASIKKVVNQVRGINGRAIGVNALFLELCKP